VWEFLNINFILGLKIKLGKINAKMLDMISLDQWFPQCGCQWFSKCGHAALMLPGNLLEIQVISAESEILGVGPSNLSFNKPTCPQGHTVGHKSLKNGTLYDYR